MALRTPLSVTPHLYMGDSTGRPLDMGTVYFGEQDKDPEFYPIDLFSDDALTLPLMQPVHTKGGYLYDKGDMVEPHAKELIYSVKVLDSYGRKVFYKGAMMRNSWNDDVIEQINTAIIGSADVARQVATDITNDAINNTAIEGGVLADTFVTATANGVGTIARTQRDKNDDVKTVQDFNSTATDGVTDVSAAFNSLLTPSGKHVIQIKRGTYLANSIVIPPNTIVYFNGSTIKRNKQIKKPVVDVGENSVIFGLNVDGQKDIYGQKDDGVRLQSGAAAIFCTSNNNSGHGFAYRSATGANESSRHFAMFCTANDNGLNPSSQGLGTGDGFYSTNSSDFLILNCTAKRNSRTGLVATSYNVSTESIDPSLAKNGVVIGGDYSDNAYNDISFEGVSNPSFSNIMGYPVLVLNNTISPQISNCKLSSVGGGNCDYPQLSNVQIHNKVRGGSLLFFTGKSPQINNVAVTYDDSIVASGIAVEVMSTDERGLISGLRVPRGYRLVKTNVHNINNLDMGYGDYLDFSYYRNTIHSVNLSNATVRQGVLTANLNTIPTKGAYVLGDRFIKTTIAADNIIEWRCTKAGVMETSDLPVFTPVYALGQGVPVTKATGVDDTAVKLNALIDSLKSAKIIKS